MKIFKDNKKYGEKVNFIDDNNVFVGYDLSQDCCEHADFYISEKEESGIIENKITEGLETYNFDTEYFKEVAYFDGDAGGIARFRLVAKDKPDLFLHLFNSHNGYYSHGFTAKIGDLAWKEGLL